MLPEQDNFYLQETNKYGKSIFASRDFAKGEIIFTISGSTVMTPTIYTVPIAFDLYIDPFPPGKFLNHSCDPSGGIKKKTGVVAMRDLKKGEEITIDYAMVVYDYDQAKLVQDVTCHCGSEICRGEFGSYAKLSDELRQKYAGFISDYLF